MSDAGAGFFMQTSEVMREFLRTVLAVLAVAGWTTPLQAAAADPSDAGRSFIPLTEQTPYLHVLHEGRSVRVQRAQDPDYRVEGYFAKTVRKCPPFCIQPMAPEAGVEVVGEVEVFEFMQNQLRDGQGLLIDARTPAWHQKETIPGSVNYPFKIFTVREGRDQLDALLIEFGAKRRTSVGWWEKTKEQWGFVDTSLKTDEWDFAAAKDLLLWCNGPHCGQSPRAIKGLLAVGYPVEKLRYYRGGMQMWKLWGLTTVVPE